MSKLIWDDIAARDYEAGVDRGVFYPPNGPGQVWNGLVSVEESPSEADDRPRYLDGKRIGNRRRLGEFSATVSAFTYPKSFSPGFIAPIQRTHFGLSYRTQSRDSYKIHLVYNAIASPSDSNYVFDDTSPFQWLLTTRGEVGPDGMIVSHLIIDTEVAYPETVQSLENVLYGNEDDDAQLPTPIEVFGIFEDNSILQIIDHGDGTWTAIGPDDVITMLDATTFQIDYPTAVYVSADTYTIHSL